MKIDEELIKQKFGNLVKSNSVYFFKKGERQNNVQCKRITLVDLTFIEENDGQAQYNVSGRGDFFENFGSYGRETDMKFNATILVQGDDILNEAKTIVYLSNLQD